MNHRFNCKNKFNKLCTYLIFLKNTKGPKLLYHVWICRVMHEEFLTLSALSQQNVSISSADWDGTEFFRLWVIWGVCFCSVLQVLW